MANGFPGYNTERREAFFKEDWPPVCAAIELLQSIIPSQGMPPPDMTRQLIDRLCKTVAILKDIVEDDQAEILALKALMKAMQRH